MNPNRPLVNLFIFYFYGFIIAGLLDATQLEST